MLRHFELVPSQPAAPVELLGHDRKAIAVIVFANYLSEGTHRWRLDRFEKPLLRLGRETFSIVEGDGQ